MRATGLQESMTQAPEAEHSTFLGFGGLVAVLVGAHLLVLFFWFWQLAKGSQTTQTKKHD